MMKVINFMVKRCACLSLLVMLSLTDIFASSYSFVPSTGIKFSWQTSDVIGLYTESGSRVRCAVQSANSNTAVFGLGGWALVDNSHYYAYSPYTSKYVEDGNVITALPISFLGQQQQSNNSTAHLAACDFMMSQFTTGTGSASVNYSHIGSIIRIEWTIPQTKTLTSLTLSTDDDSFISEANMNLPMQIITATKRSASATLALSNIHIQANATLVAYMMVAPTDLKGKTITATLTAIDGTTLNATLDGATILAGKVYPVTIGVDDLDKEETPTESKSFGIDTPVVTSVTQVTAYAPDFAIDTVNMITVVPKWQKGDVNHDGVVDIVDAVELNGCYLRGSTSDLDLNICDMNDDGQIDVVDVVAITSKYLSGK